MTELWNLLGFLLGVLPYSFDDGEGEWSTVVTWLFVLCVIWV